MAVKVAIRGGKKRCLPVVQLSLREAAQLLRSGLLAALALNLVLLAGLLSLLNG